MQDMHLFCINNMQIHKECIRHNKGRYNKLRNDSLNIKAETHGGIRKCKVSKEH